jgi:hypothetical protein
MAKKEPLHPVLLVLILMAIFLLIIGLLYYQKLSSQNMEVMEVSPFELCDLNHDGQCDDEDRQIFNNSFGSCRGDQNYNFNADIDGDGCVVTADEQVFISQ